MRAPSIHTHSRFCDGVGEIEEYIQAALAVGLPAFGASAHQPVPWPSQFALPLTDMPAYRAEVQRLREKYQGQIEVYLGLELDYIPTIRPFVETHVLPHTFDYFIGSVHRIRELNGEPWGFETNARVFETGLSKIFHGDIRQLIEEYYALEREVAAWPEVTIIGHLDRIKIHNVGERYFSEQAAWYIDAVEETLQTIARLGKIVELNTSGWRRDHDAPYPSAWIVRRCAELQIPVCITPDAHKPEQVMFKFVEAADLMRSVGHRSVAVLKNGQWTQERLP